MTEPIAFNPRARVNRHAGSMADDLPDDIEELTAAATVDVEEEPTRIDFLLFTVAANGAAIEIVIPCVFSATTTASDMVSA